MSEKALSTHFERLPDDATGVASSGSLDALIPLDDTTDAATTTLATLPVGARLVVRCRADWRTATVSRIAERITLIVHAPRGGTYRIRRPPETLLHFDGLIPILSATDTECSRAVWLGGMARYDVRW